MTVAEVIRQQTLSIKDSLASLERELARAISERDAANERVKRCSTEITRQRALESESKKLLNAASAKVIEAQRILDDFERKRHEALENLLQCQEEVNEIAQSLHKVQDASEAAVAEIRKEQRDAQEAELNITRLRGDLNQKKDILRQAVLHALGVFLKHQIEQLQTAFDSQEQQADAIRAYEEFKKARHTEPDIIQLCEQREEFQKLLGTAVVPGVKDMLQASLRSVEEQLGRRFPIALAPPRQTEDNQINDLLYFCNKKGKIVFLLPIDSNIWNNAEIPVDSTTKAMCFIWNFVHELNFTIDSGKFTIFQEWPVFESNLDIEDVAVLQSFCIEHHSSIVIHFVFSAVPTELQEALIYESENV